MKRDDKRDDTGTRPIRDNSGVTFPPPLVYIALLILGCIIQFFRPLHIVDPTHSVAVKVAGFALMIVGLTLMASAVGVFRSVGTSLIPVKPTTALAFGGPYRFTRTPMYLSMLVVSSGIAVIANAVWLIIMLPVMVIVIDRTVIRREERYLAIKFGEPYTAYTSRVRRWI